MLVYYLLIVGKIGLMLVIPFLKYGVSSPEYLFVLRFLAAVLAFAIGAYARFYREENKQSEKINKEE